MVLIYTHEMKKKLSNRIKKLKKKEDVSAIINIILVDNPQYMQNQNGVFMFFHKLENSTYDKIEVELKKINKNSKCFTESSIGSETLSEKKEYKPYVKNEFPSQDGISPKLKFSNREKTLIKRRRYDTTINQDNDSDVLYKSFNVADLSETIDNIESDKISINTVLQK
jgi:hypothetical protein